MGFLTLQLGRFVVKQITFNISGNRKMTSYITENLELVRSRIIAASEKRAQEARKSMF